MMPHELSATKRLLTFSQPCFHIKTDGVYYSQPTPPVIYEICATLPHDQVCWPCWLLLADWFNKCTYPRARVVDPVDRVSSTYLSNYTDIRIGDSPIQFLSILISNAELFYTTSPIQYIPRQPFLYRKFINRNFTSRYFPVQSCPIFLYRSSPVQTL